MRGRSDEAGMAAEVLLPRRSAVYRALHRAALERRCIFLAGLSGVGKSLMLQQLALIANEVGRVVHLLQWDVARGACETPDLLARYPELEGVTHAAIRKAVGLWAREAVWRWDRAHGQARHLLIGETPLLGNRLIELAQPGVDGVEPLLAGRGSLFLIPAPSCAVRRVIEASRAREMASPLHERERANAAPSLLRAHWDEVARVARQLGVPGSRTGEGYDPAVYVAVYRRLLRHRRRATLPITSVLPVRASPYELGAVASELMPTPDDVERIMLQVEAYPDAQLQREVDNWFET
jgi:hypothetical protein